MDRESFSSSATETEKFIIAISVVFGVLIIGAAVAGAVWYCKMLKKDERKAKKHKYKKDQSTQELRVIRTISADVEPKQSPLHSSANSESESSESRHHHETRSYPDGIELMDTHIGAVSSGTLSGQEVKKVWRSRRDVLELSADEGAVMYDELGTVPMGQVTRCLRFPDDDDDLDYFKDQRVATLLEFYRE